MFPSFYCFCFADVCFVVLHEPVGLSKFWGSLLSLLVWFILAFSFFLVLSGTLHVSCSWVSNFPFFLILYATCIPWMFPAVFFLFKFARCFQL